MNYLSFLLVENRWMVMSLSGNQGDRQSRAVWRVVISSALDMLSVKWL